MERCSQLHFDSPLSSGTGASVNLHRDSQGKAWVRKTEGGSCPPNAEQKTTQPVAVFFDHVRFNNGARLVATAGCAERCSQKCTVSPFIEGQSLSEILGPDNSGLERVAQLRSTLVDSMKAGGYFDQSTLGSPAQNYRSRFLETPRIATWLERERPFQINGNEITSVVRDAVTHLCSGDYQVPLGMFPNDLNVTNILYWAEGNEIRVIDQGMVWSSPCIPLVKMMIGWRGLSALMSQKTDWLTVDIQGLLNTRDRTKELDKLHVQSIISAYSWAGESQQQILIRELAAMQILTTFISLNKNFEKNQLPPQEIIDQVIGPFFADAVEEFSH